MKNKKLTTDNKKGCKMKVQDRLVWIRAYIESADMDEVNRDVLRRQLVLLTVEITEENE